MIDRWSQISSAFDTDGSLRDIYILDTSLAQWEQVWAFLLERRTSLTLRIGDKTVPLPNQVDPIFAARRRGDAATLCCRIGRITLNCHFFVEEEVEFDVDPREIRDVGDANDIAWFLTGLCEATGREVLLTLENTRDGIIAKVEPGDGDVHWQSS